MKFKFAMLLGAALFWLAATAFAATNDLTSALQKGLFEEEANHDLEAAIQAYQTVATQFDKDRKLAATAIFRLGECYRKQGNTNQANAQFERVLREFADQTPLVTLSRTYLAAAGQGQAAAGAATNRAGTFQERLASIQTAAEADEVKRIQAMIKDSPDLINAQQEGSGRTQLHQAAERGEMVVARFLLTNGAEVNAKEKSGWTPLHLAARNGHKAMVELLLDYKADVQPTDQFGYTPLHFAADKGFRSVLEVLLAHQASANAKTKGGDTPLHAAARNGFKGIAEVLIGQGAEVNAANDSGITPLHLAAQRGDQALAEVLLASKADVKAASREGWTPLHLAAQNGQVGVAALLLAHGAAVDARTTAERKRGWTPLHMAVQAGQKEMVPLLLQHQADPNARIATSDFSEFSPGYTPLLIATVKDFPEIVESLLAFKADPNLQSDTRTAPVFNAMSSRFPTADRKRMLTALLDHGADVNAKDLNGQTCLAFAVWEDNKDLVEFLLAHKANVNTADKDGYTPLHFVAGNVQQLAQPHPNAKVIAELFLAAGANVNAQTTKGVTPLKHIGTAARMPGSPGAQLAELLRQHGAREQMPDFASVRLTRKGLEQPILVFSRDTNALNHFTLLETIGYYYSNPWRFGNVTGTGPGGIVTVRPGDAGIFPFPDLVNLRIHRPVPGKSGEQNVIPVVLAKGTNTIDGANDLRLEFGDVVEIPERVHGLAEAPVGLTRTQMEALEKCVRRHVTVSVPGDHTEVSLNGLAGDTYLSGCLKRPEVQKILRSSSDFTRVRVIRTAPGSAQPKVVTQNVQLCWDNQEAASNTLWLRDGDVVEVPDKP